MFRLIGVIYLPPLPGSGNAGAMDLDAIVNQAIDDANTLNDAGYDAALISNAHDTPLTAKVPIQSVTSMTVVANEIRRVCAIPLGVDVEHNHGAAAAAIAGAAGCSFVRVKVLTGAAVGPSGILKGCANAVARVRSSFTRPLEVLADVQETTSVNLSFDDPATLGRQHLQFGGATSLVVTSDAGVDVALSRIRAIKESVGEGVDVLIGGRANLRTIHEIRENCDGAIVATAIRAGSRPSDKIDSRLAKELALVP